MMAEYTETCTVCPNSCLLQIREDKNGICVSGNRCIRGEAYAVSERTDPMRVLTTTVVLTGSRLRRLPVISDRPIPVRLLSQCLEAAHAVKASAPVTDGDVLISDLCGTGAALVAARTVHKT